MQKLDEKWRHKIIIDASICNGEPCIKGTRVMISVILDCLTEGLSEDEIISEYPSLMKGDVKIAIEYQKYILASKEVEEHEPIFKRFMNRYGEEWRRLGE